MTNTTNQDYKVADISPGKFFGEMSLLTGEPRSATIKAATNVLAYEIKKLHIEGFLKDRPEIIDQIGEIVAQRQLNTTTELEKLRMTADTGYKESFSEQIASKIRSFFIGFGGDYIEQ